MWQDAVNSSFLLLGGLLNWLNVRRVWKDKKVTGTSPWPWVCFTSWGIWDCYYFPHLNQWFSLVGTLMAVLPNTIWLTMWWYYRHKELTI